MTGLARITARASMALTATNEGMSEDEAIAQCERVNVPKDRGVQTRYRLRFLQICVSLVKGLKKK